MADRPKGLSKAQRRKRFGRQPGDAVERSLEHACRGCIVRHVDRFKPEAGEPLEVRCFFCNDSSSSCGVSRGKNKKKKETRKVRVANSDGEEESGEDSEEEEIELTPMYGCATSGSICEPVSNELEFRLGFVSDS